MIFVTALRPFLLVLALLLFQRGDVHRHRPPFHPGCLLDGPKGTHLLGQPVKEPFPDLRVGHLAATESHREFDFISPIKKLRALAALRVEVMPGDLRLQANLFEFDDMLIAARFPFFLALFVPVFAVVHQATNGWDGIRSHFDEVETP
ncbi:MAG: hypothetical protein H0T91_04170 [Propionibacteriaceae bacterium]|nr:hypothetical protein [Propionibacteriaceae bacterium]